jgi:hypothetical protein
MFTTEITEDTENKRGPIFKIHGHGGRSHP